MPWSTREIADLAGTSLRAVRHYHDVGLLPEPPRRSNGYKQYGVAHLVRLLRVKRLVDLGFSLSRIAAMDEDDQHPGEELRALDAELAARIEQLQQVRAELGLLLRHGVPTELPTDFAGVDGAASLSDADRSLAAVMSRVLGPQRRRAYAQMLDNVPADPTDGEFDTLPADAGPARRRELAERLVPHVRAILAANPGLAPPHPDTPGGDRLVVETAAAAVRELYNPAQVDVIRRIGVLMHADADHPNG